MTNPYYRDDQVTLYHGDCLEVSAWLDADVLVTDPPYGINIGFRMNKDSRNAKPRKTIHGDRSTLARDRALSDWGGAKSAMIFGRWDVTPPSSTRIRLVWDKCGGFMGDRSLPWGLSDEEIYVIGHGFTGKREGSVIRVQMLMAADRERPDHPTPKPVPLLERLIDKCPPGSVADPFAGSGSTLIAARNLGRKAIGVELEERYCEIVATRLSQGCLDFQEGA